MATNKFKNLRARMAPERQARVAARTQELLAGMTLQDLRKVRELTQEKLAEDLGVTQPTLSKLERRTDMYVSTLRKVLETMGAELVIVARFPDQDVAITQFEDMGETPKRATG